MRRYVEFPLEAGGSIVVEAEELSTSVTRGLRPTDLSERAGETFEAALAHVRPAAVTIVERLRELVDPPDEIDVEFGIRLSAEFGAIVAKAAGDANFRVTMRWKRAAPPSV